MLKESIICTVIIVAIVYGNIVTQNYTKESISSLSEELTNLKTQIEQNKETPSQQELQNKIYEINSNWEQRHEKLAYFIEHDELEKVETKLTGIKSKIETEDYKEAINNVDEGVFILQHIEDKNAFNWQNIF